MLFKALFLQSLRIWGKKCRRMKRTTVLEVKYKYLIQVRLVIWYTIRFRLSIRIRRSLNSITRWVIELWRQPKMMHLKASMCRQVWNFLQLKKVSSMINRLIPILHLSSKRRMATSLGLTRNYKSITMPCNKTETWNTISISWRVWNFSQSKYKTGLWK